MIHVAFHRRRDTLLLGISNELTSTPLVETSPDGSKLEALKAQSTNTGDVMMTASTSGAAVTPKVLRIFTYLYSREFIRLTLCGFSHHSRLRGGGAYLCGFTPWKQLSCPSSAMKN